jgi:hypothetical protein
MTRHAARLQTLARKWGLCATHGTSQTCRACHASEPLPEVLSSGMKTLIDALVDRVGRAALLAAIRRVTPPVSDVCPRCGHTRACPTCQEGYTKAILSSIGLTTKEQSRVHALLATCRALEP